MRLPNSYGSITKLKGNRRRPWMVRVTASIDFDEKTKKYSQRQRVLGYYKSRQEAMKVLAEYNDDPYDLDALTVTFDDCYQEAHKKFSESRRCNYEAAYKYLEPIKDKPIRSIKAAQMQRCIDSCTTTQQREIKTVCRKVYEYALFAEFVDKNPSDHIKCNNVEATIDRIVFTPEEIKIIEEADTWWKVCLACLIYSGMRSKELRTLDADDIDLENMTINIREGKNKYSIRKIPIHTHAEGYFRRYKEEGIGFYGKSHNGFNKAISREFDIEHHAHDTRHTFATVMRKCKADSLILELILGHTPKTITEKIYTHITMEEMRENIELLKY